MAASTMILPISFSSISYLILVMFLAIFASSRDTEVWIIGVHPRSSAVPSLSSFNVQRPIRYRRRLPRKPHDAATLPTPSRAIEGADAPFDTAEEKPATSNGPFPTTSYPLVASSEAFEASLASQNVPGVTKNAALAVERTLAFRDTPLAACSLERVIRPHCLQAPPTHR